MAFNDKITTSLRGRRLGLQIMSSVHTGGSRGPNEFLVGPDDFKVEVNTTAESTSVYLKAHGISKLLSSSAGSSQVYTLDPPIPGVSKTIFNSTNATAFIKLVSGVIQSTVGSTQTVIAFPAAGHSMTLTGVTTALWLTETATASGINLTNST
jgi:hypothetical protein